jgi:hypothetical protein
MRDIELRRVISKGIYYRFIIRNNNIFWIDVLLYIHIRIKIIIRGLWYISRVFSFSSS